MATPKSDLKTPTKSPTKTPRKKKSLKPPTTPTTPINNSPGVDSTIQRRFSDILVTLHRCVQTWEKNNQESFNTANTLCNLYTQWDSMKDEEDLLNLIEICKRKFFVKLANNREDLLMQLKEHQQKLELLMKKMMGLITNMKAIHYLGTVSKSDTDGEASQQPIFNNWTASEFYQKAKLIFDAYTKEYYLKKSFYDKFFEYRVEAKNKHGTNALSQCVNYWLHQPYLDKRSEFLLEAMLVEADLK